jgi:hypothetical protein
VGDEFQGVFADVVSAVRATLLLRLQLLKDQEVDSRYGLGYGEVTIFRERVPVSQDGPGWWSARSAIEQVAAMADSARTGFARTYFACDPAGSFREGPALNAFLLCRDAIVAQMRPRNRRLLLGLLLDRTQAELAAEEGISQSAVSQNLAGSGAYAVEAADHQLAVMFR